MAAALHRVDLRRGDFIEPPKFAKLPEWAQRAYVERADFALRVVERWKRLADASGT
jgi:hypothetical protein